MKIAFHTLGCKVNQYETEAISQIFVNNGWEIGDFSEICDAYLINTCSVTSLSDRKSRQMIRRAISLNENAVVAVCGCYAQTAPEEIEKIEGVNVIIGTKDKLKAYELINEAYNNKKIINIVSDIRHEKNYEDMEITCFESKTRAIIKAQDGCNNFCSYCIIPYARGPVRSRPLESVYEEAKRLADRGFFEIVLSGIHICLYGRDLKDVSLIDLIKKIHQIDGIKRIRLSSIEPNAFTDEFIEEIKKLPKLCHHFHISLQSGCTETLKRMNRKYTAEFYKETVDKLVCAFPDTAITTDLITGFPGETEEEFAKTVEFVKSVPFYQIHTFKYSVRKGTKAADMPNQVPPQKKEERSREIIAISAKKEKEFQNKFIGETFDVLFEKEVSKNVYLGHTMNYLPVYLKSEENLEGKIKGVLISDGEIFTHKNVNR
ncbi:MAG: tRNA (N(6)-L-threonylcarbamoyladenosine(37)-C(2))-methylthiotransferase MtaB [Clostridia bacterium]|nr:tRNA (N(6)-L-threonylcarbamoyladenosine(37)-C(2))-methylthiotransferase MtaB [Clostridia bacterium]